MSTSLPKLIALVGPTASGKTDLALQLAKKYNGYVISADSRQIYRQMNIGTGKPALGAVEMVCDQPSYDINGIRHFMFDMVSPDQTYTVAEYKDAVYRLISDMRREYPDNIPFLVGGTGLYVSAVIENWEIPKVAPTGLREDLEKRTLDDLVQELQNRAPDVAKRIDIKNKRRVVRALEVVLEGKSFDQARGPRMFDILLLGLDVPREELYTRIDARVDAMMAAGLLDEVKSLAAKYDWDVPAMSGIGYRQFRPVLEGKMDLAEAVEKLKQDTRHYAKKQLTWWRKREGMKCIKNTGDSEDFIEKFLQK